MAVLHLAFEDGFRKDHVRVRADGHVVYERKEVTTRTQIGLADAADVVLSDAMVDLTIEVPSRTATVQLRLDLARPLFLAVSLTERGDLTHKVSHEPFRYA
jgi:hypothetical protein